MRSKDNLWRCHLKSYRWRSGRSFAREKNRVHLFYNNINTQITCSALLILAPVTFAHRLPILTSRVSFCRLYVCAVRVCVFFSYSSAVWFIDVCACCVCISDRKINWNLNMCMQSYCARAFVQPSHCIIIIIARCKMHVCIVLCIFIALCAAERSHAMRRWPAGIPACCRRCWWISRQTSFPVLLLHQYQTYRQSKSEYRIIYYECVTNKWILNYRRMALISVYILCWSLQTQCLYLCVCGCVCHSAVRMVLENLFFHVKRFYVDLLGNFTSNAHYFSLIFNVVC